MSRGKIAVEERVKAAKACAEGRMSQAEAARRLGLHKSTVEEWVRRYEAGGALAFKEQEHNTVYTEELKAEAVREYLDGKGSLKEISAKYGIRSTIDENIDYYNSKRLQRNLGVLTPMEKHERFYLAA